MKKVTIFWVNGKSQTWVLQDAKVGDAIAQLTRTHDATLAVLGRIEAAL